MSRPAAATGSPRVELASVGHVDSHHRFRIGRRYAYAADVPASLEAGLIGFFSMKSPRPYARCVVKGRPAPTKGGISAFRHIREGVCLRTTGPDSSQMELFSVFLS